MQKLKNNKKYMIIKNKYKEYYIINKTENKLMLSDNENNYLIIQPKEKRKLKKEQLIYVQN